ncbi:hypothetical protein BKI52_04250 [marine bacterium AO1-C]|nr:hypothetical protein BKI52_04250 [marine bacterium AO1-C]
MYKKASENFRGFFINEGKHYYQKTLNCKSTNEHIITTMKKQYLYIFFFIISLGTYVPGYAQVGDIIGAAGSIGEGCGDGCSNGAGCANGCNASDIFFLTQLIEWNSQWIDNHADHPVPLGVEVMLDASIVPIKYNIYRPRIRVNLGFLSTDYRYSILVEEKLGETDIYATHDWQMFVMNPVLTNSFAMRLGVGVVYEEVTRNVFQDYNLGLDFYLFDQAVKFAMEGRYAYNYAARISPRVEANGALKFRILNTEGFKIYGGLNAFYARYYESIDLWSVGVGLNFRFE